jgi:hypothetical protein
VSVTVITQLVPVAHGEEVSLEEAFACNRRVS